MRCLLSIDVTCATSNPIHELRLDQTVANTVIALTIRVIYLSLIITLKRGVVVLWFTVTCPLSSGFLPTIIPAEQFLSPKLNCAFTHTHQALTITKPPNRTSIHDVCKEALLIVSAQVWCVYVCTCTYTHTGTWTLLYEVYSATLYPYTLS